MAMRTLRWMVLGGLSTVWALQPKELEEWFASSSGLAMSPSDAQQEATRSWNPLAKCGVEISTLQALRDALHDSSSLDLSLEVIRKQIIELAEQHIKADKKQLYGALSGVYTLSGGLQLPKAEAQAMTHLLALKRAEPDDLKELYKVMYGYYGLGFDRALAQAQSIQLAEAGADAASYKETFSATVQKGQQAALIEASKVSVAKNLNGLVRRYALDGKAYTASEFQQSYYGEGWLSAWIESPMEKRLSTDRRAYTADQFSRHFGRSWASLYQSRPEATQLRLAEDDQVYKMAEYQKYYGDQWHEKWSASPELACQECSPYTTRVSTSVVAV